MIAKITKGKSFSGLMRYLFQPEKSAEVLYADGVCTASARMAAEDFSMQATQNPRLSQPVGHIALAFSANDAPSDALMLEIAQKYLRAMGINNTQVVIAAHRDQPHPHLHVVFNRCNNSGRTISNQNDRVRSVKICRQLTEQYGLYVAPNKEQVRRHRLREPDKTRYALYDLLCVHVPQVHSWGELADQISKGGATLELRRDPMRRVYGVCFSMNGLHFYGSKVDKKFSYGRIKRLFKTQVQIIRHTPTQSLAPTRSSAKGGNSLYSDLYRLASAMARSARSNEPEEEQEKKQYEHIY